MTSSKNSKSNTLASTLPPPSPEWFLQAYTPEILTSDFVIRSLRRRLWKAFQEDNPELALKAYQATKEDFEEWLEEEQIERDHLIELKHQQQPQLQEEQSNFKEKGSTSLGSGRKSQTRKAHRGSGTTGSHGTASAGTSASNARTTGGASSSTTAAAAAASSVPYEASFHCISLDHLKGPILQSQMNPSEPFIADDYLNPYDLESYDYPARKNLPNVDQYRMLQQAKQQEEFQRSRQSRRPRLAAFNIFRRSSATTEGGRPVRWDEDLNRRQANAVMGRPMAPIPGSLEHQTSISTTLTSLGGGSGEIPDSNGRAAVEDDATMTTPLHEASRLGSGDFVRFLLANGGDPNIKNGMSRTALHLTSGGLTQEEERLLQAMIKQRNTNVGGSGTRPSDKKKVKGKKKKVHVPVPTVGISSPSIPSDVFALMKEEAQKAKDAKAENNYYNNSGSSTSNKTGVAKVMGRLVRSALGNSKPKEHAPSPPPEPRAPGGKTRKSKFDATRWNHLLIERMDSVMAVLAWYHSETGEGPSINAVDSDGRTALHYAAELGRSEICMAILSNFGAMLTIIDGIGARTPCELAGANGHKELAARLEARALLYIDPYGVDEELMANMLQMESNRSNGRNSNKSEDPRRQALVAPFAWFETMTPDRVGAERIQRLERTRAKILKAVLSYQSKSKVEKSMALAEQLGLAAAMQAQGDNSDKDEAEEEIDGDTKTATEKSSDDSEKITSMDGSIKSDSDSSDRAESSRAAAEEAELEAAFNAALSGPDTNDELVKLDINSESKKPAANEESAPSLDRTSSISLQVAFSNLQESHVERFLSQHKWNVSEAVKAFKSDPLTAFTKAGIALPTEPPANSETVEIDGRTCLICYDDEVEEDDWVELSGCVHGFCTDCLKDYLKDCASTKTALSSISCPHHECGTRLTTQEVDSLLATEPDAAARIHEATYEQFVTAAHDFKFCNHPGCPGIIHRLPQTFLTKHGIDDALIDFAGAVCTANASLDSVVQIQDFPFTYEGVEEPNYLDCRSSEQPRSAHRFCFRCGEGKHWPVTCQRLEEWQNKVREEIGTGEDDKDENSNFSELAQKLWIKTNTRPCPKCDVPIEKDDGCNHMTCTNPACRYEFCWICRKDWKLHGAATGGFFRCNIWQEEQDASGVLQSPGSRSNEDLDDPSSDQGYGTAIHSAREAFRVRQEMARFVHHYTRWEAHGQSASLEKNMADTVSTRLAPVVKAVTEFDGSPDFNFGGKGLSFVHAAFTELLECRSVLKHSYAFSYFRYPTLYYFRRFGQLNSRRREKASFERLQSELEMLTEQMSDIVARAHLRATQVQITFLTANAAEKREDFSNLIFSILHDERKEEILEEKLLSTSASASAIASPRGRHSHSHSQSRRTLGVALRRGSDSSDEDDDGIRAGLSQLLARGMPLDLDDPPGLSLVQMWECPACTYMNSSGHRCAMCGTLR